jgi:phosphate starvation-inducible protein PhoH
MAKSKKVETFDEAPQTLDNHPFYGFETDSDQKDFRDNIWNPEKKIIFCNAKAGSGKTLIAFATANLLYQYGLYDGIIYVVSPYGESKQGFLPGSITEKSEVYFEPLYQAIVKCQLFPMKVIYDESLVSETRGQGYVKCLTHTYLRGTNFENKVVILDETQNYNFGDLKKALTRINDNCKVIVIGHTLQKDTYDTTDAFERYIRYYESMNDSRVAICKLTKNYRGWISQTADELQFV